jgi:hypothetical protein
VKRISKTALREAAGLSAKQFRDIQAWGLIPERPDGGWVEADVERLRQVRDLGASVRSYHRRAIRLQDARWPIPGDKLRQAMIDTLPSIEAPKKKMRALYRALQVRYGHVSSANADRLRVPATWRLPDPTAWAEVFRWPTDGEFSQIGNSVWADAQSLVSSPLVTRSGLLEGIPMEEIAILLMTRQLTLPEQSFPDAPSTTDTGGIR